MELRLDKELLAVESYPEYTSKVELVQTHISWVFITDNFVYKVKKPVNFGFLDFSTLAKRKYYCEQEVLLNRRLAPEIYLGVVPVMKESKGRLAFGGEGKIVDYSVKMKKLPIDRLMSNLLKESKLNSKMIQQVAKKIADFHASAESSPKIAKFGSPELIKINTDENFEQTKKYIGVTITQGQYKQMKKYTDNFYGSKTELIKKRIDEGRIKDCHGDLHLQHVCITDKIIIFDCIEFNERFRYSDTAADIAFLAMDLDYNNRKDFADSLIDYYVDYTNDSELYEILNFYKLYRAYVRGKVISFQLDDQSLKSFERAKALDTAKKYFELAYSYI